MCQHYERLCLVDERRLIRLDWTDKKATIGTLYSIAVQKSISERTQHTESRGGLTTGGGNASDAAEIMHTRHYDAWLCVITWLKTGLIVKPVAGLSGFHVPGWTAAGVTDDGVNIVLWRGLIYKYPVVQLAINITRVNRATYFCLSRGC